MDLGYRGPGAPAAKTLRWLTRAGPARGTAGGALPWFSPGSPARSEECAARGFHRVTCSENARGWGKVNLVVPRDQVQYSGQSHCGCSSMVER